MNNEPITVLPSDKNKPKRLHVKCYHDFLDCDILSGDEKILYLCFKRFIKFANDNDGCCDEKVFPSLQSIKRMTGWSNYRVDSVMKKLIDKGLISKKRNGLGKNNTYYITDKEDMFKAHTVKEMVELSQETEIDMYIRKIREAGYEVHISKPKELPTVPVTATEESPQPVDDNNTGNEKMQPRMLHACNMSFEDLKKLVEYDDILSVDLKKQKDVLDSVMKVLFDTITTSKDTIRVNKEDKPRDVVVAQLMKLTPDHIKHVVDKYSNHDKKIENGTPFIRTLLYNAEVDYMHELEERLKENGYR